MRDPVAYACVILFSLFGVLCFGVAAAMIMAVVR